MKVVLEFVTRRFNNALTVVLQKKRKVQRALCELNNSNQMQEHGLGLPNTQDACNQFELNNLAKDIQDVQPTSRLKNLVLNPAMLHNWIE